MKQINLDNILSKVLKKKYSAFFYTPPIYKNAISYFYESPKKTISANSITTINNILKEFDNKNLLAYSLINYEAGYALERSLNKYYSPKKDLILLNIFNKNNVRRYNSNEINFGEYDRNKYKISNYKLNTSKKEYLKNIDKIKDYLEKGDTYQVNYTIKSNFKFIGNYISLFKSLLFNQSAKFAAFINMGEKMLMSLSPELFFSIENREITTLPMKGTLHRGYNLREDAQKQNKLNKSEKDKAENVMIVDLLRNDIGKICKYGSVKGKGLFTIEKYESLFQMVSKVTGKLRKNISNGDMIKELFPCGSVTGAPKIRTMEIINELEKEERGIYTGGIGIIDKDKATFNVAIRTIEINRKNGKGEMGLGSGIIIDSIGEKEYEEVKLKGQFLTKPKGYFELFETMLVSNGVVKDWSKHINRIKKASDYFLFNFRSNEFNKIKSEIMSKIKNEKQYRLKILLKKDGAINYILSEFVNPKDEIKILLSEKKINSESPFQYFKTTNRKLYENEFIKYNKQGFSEVIFLNEKGELSEGAITNIFVKIDGEWHTPKLECGILNGIEREKLLQKNKKIKESIILENDLKKSESIILTNSLRGIRFVNELQLINGEVIKLQTNNF